MQRIFGRVLAGYQGSHSEQQWDWSYTNWNPESIDKFKNRAIKCKKAAESCDNVAPSQDNGTPKNLCDTLQRWHGLSSTAIIANFLNNLRNLDTSRQALKADVKKCMVISQEACMIGILLILSPINSCDQVSDVVTGLGKSFQQYPALLRRVQKLGAYYRVAWRVRTLLKDPNFFKLRGSIRFVEVNFPCFFSILVSWTYGLSKIPFLPQKTFVVPRNLAEILNEDAKKSHSDQVTLKDIALKYPNQSLPATGSASITVSTHCELTLALHALHSPFKPKTIEIGVSKRLCWLCQKFVENLRVAGAIRVFASENQGKIHADWGMPPDTPSGIEFSMRQLVELEIEQLRTSIIARRRSDSFWNELTWFCGWRGFRCSPMNMYASVAIVMFIFFVAYLWSINAHSWDR